MTKKNLEVTLQKSDGKWILGAAAPDRVNDTISDAAFNKALKSIGGKLIALWQHNSDQPVGYWDALAYKAGQLIGNLTIADTNLGKMIKQLLQDEVPLGASIGFRSLSAEPNHFGGLHFTEIELLETSIVSVPAQPIAMQIAKKFGVDISPEGITAPAPSGPKSETETIQKAKAAILSANKLLRAPKCQPSN